MYIPWNSFIAGNGRNRGCKLSRYDALSKYRKGTTSNKRGQWNRGPTTAGRMTTSGTTPAPHLKPLALINALAQIAWAPAAAVQLAVPLVPSSCFLRGLVMRCRVALHGHIEDVAGGLLEKMVSWQHCQAKVADWSWSFFTGAPSVNLAHCSDHHALGCEDTKGPRTHQAENSKTLPTDVILSTFVAGRGLMQAIGLEVGPCKPHLWYCFQAAVATFNTAATFLNSALRGYSGKVYIKPRDR